jgi:hypothetical protein
MSATGDPSRDPAGASSPEPASVQAYLEETMTFGDLDDLVNDATRSIADGDR